MSTVTAATDVLQDVHTATNDALEGYREMSSRARPDIEPTIGRLVELHERHAAEQAALLSADHDADVGDTSVQGSVNKAVVIVRDWFTGLDRDTLPAVRQGEEALLGKYTKALADGGLTGQSRITSLLREQMSEIEQVISHLPRD